MRPSEARRFSGRLAQRHHPPQRGMRAMTERVVLSEYDALRGTDSPEAIRFCAGVEQTLGNKKNLIASVVEKLCKDGGLTVEALPFSLGPKRYGVHTEPVHPTGKSCSNPIVSTNLPRFPRLNPE